jgi:hypothetical protein
VLLPGDLEIVARLAGYDAFFKTIVIEPGQDRNYAWSCTKRGESRPARKMQNQNFP